MTVDGAPNFTSTPKRQGRRSVRSLWTYAVEQSRTLRPHSWSGVLQSLIPRRAAPPPPPPACKPETKAAPLYAEINKKRPPPQNTESGIYCVAEKIQSPSCFDNHGGESLLCLCVSLHKSTCVFD